MSNSARSGWLRLLVVVALAASSTAVAAVSLVAAAQPSGQPEGRTWVGSWSTTPLVGSTSFADRTLREIVHTSLGGDEIRIRLTNAFGTEGIAIDDVTVGLRASGATLVAGTEHAVTFAGAHGVTLPAGAEVFSDPVQLAVGDEQDLAISLHVPGPTGPATRHSTALTTSYSAAGDHAADAGSAAFTSTSSSWYLLDGVDVLAAPGTEAVVALGDSITDGTNSTVDAEIGRAHV